MVLMTLAQALPSMRRSLKDLASVSTENARRSARAASMGMTSMRSPSTSTSVTSSAAPELELPPTIPGPQIPLADVLPASIVGVVSPTVAAPVQVPPVAAVPSQRERSRRNQIVVSLLLLGLVVVLAGVLIWVLKREMNQTPVEKKETAVSGREFQLALAMTGFDSITNSHSQAGVDQ